MYAPPAALYADFWVSNPFLLHGEYHGQQQPNANGCKKHENPDSQWLINIHELPCAFVFVFG